MRRNDQPPSSWAAKAGSIGKTKKNDYRVLTPADGNSVNSCLIGNSGPGTLGIGKARQWGGMGGGGAGGGTRVISRSGVEVRQGGILPSGGVRAREVSGKVMEEGRGRSDWF